MGGQRCRLMEQVDEDGRSDSPKGIAVVEQGKKAAANAMQTGTSRVSTAGSGHAFVAMLMCGIGVQESGLELPGLHGCGLADDVGELQLPDQQQQAEE